MNYRETLENAKKHKIDVLMLTVAEEVSCQFNGKEIELTEEQFETACYWVKRAYLKSEGLTIDSLTRALISLIQDTPLEEFDDIYGLMQVASYCYS